MQEFSSTTIMQTASSGDAGQLRDVLKSKAISSLYYFNKVVMGAKDMTPNFHLPLCDRVQNDLWKMRRGYLAPRAHLKSTIGKGYSLWRLAGGGFKKVDYNDAQYDPRNRRYLYVGESDERVCRLIRNIKWHILNNQMLRWLFPELIPPDINVKGWIWRDDEILLPRTESFDEGSIKAIGVGTKVTGYHGDGFFFDDLIGEEAGKSETEMKRTNEWLEVRSGLRNNPNDFEEIYWGTRWKFGNADTYGWLMENEPFLVGESGIPTGIDWHVLSACDDEFENIAWPERFTKEYLMSLCAPGKEYYFSCQYLNKPITKGSGDFPGELLKTFSVTHDEEGKLTKIIPSDGTPPVKLKNLLRITFYDPSSGGKSAECENAVIALGSASDGRKFVLDAFLKNCGYRAAIEEWHKLNDKFMCYPNYYEAVGAQKTIEEFIAPRRLYSKCEICGESHRKLVPVGIKPPGGSMNKDERIRHFLQPTVEEGKVYFHEKLVKLRLQVVQFPHAKFKDGADALAYAVNLSKNPISIDEAEAQARDEAREKEVVPSARVNTERVYGGYV